MTDDPVDDEIWDDPDLDGHADLRSDDPVDPVFDDETGPSRSGASASPRAVARCEERRWRPPG